jgi:drug/metabolite transporter (DMT)-like permease
VNLRRLLRADVLAAIAALVLLFVMALDWYSTTAGQEARRIEELSQPSGGLGGEVEREVQETARFAAEEAEKNAWQASAAIDRIILAGLVATFLLAIATAYLRAAGRRFEPPLTPSAATAVTATLTALVVAYRSIQEPGLDQGTTVESGVPLALVVLGVIALASRSAMREEEEGTAWREPQAAVPGPTVGERPA